MKTNTVHPKHCLDRILWPILRYTLEPLTRKISHGWHWIPSMPPKDTLLAVEKDPNAKEDAGWLSNFWLHNFGWKTVVVLAPTPESKCMAYQVGFATIRQGLNADFICTIICNGPVALSVGGKGVKFFARETRDYNPVPLQLLKRTTKREMDPSIPLL